MDLKWWLEVVPCIVKWDLVALSKNKIWFLLYKVIKRCIDGMHILRWMILGCSTSAQMIEHLSRWKLVLGIVAIYLLLECGGLFMWFYELDIYFLQYFFFLWSSHSWILFCEAITTQNPSQFSRADIDVETKFSSCSYCRHIWILKSERALLNWSTIKRQLFFVCTLNNDHA